MKKNTNKFEKVLAILLFIIILAISSYFNFNDENQVENKITSNKISYEISNIPEYNGEKYIQINNNVPEFTAEDMELQDDYYSSLENGRVRNGYNKNELGEGECG